MHLYYRKLHNLNHPERTDTMENFIYSVNATIPVFLVMVIGYILRQYNILDEHFAKKANSFNFKVTLPALLFQDIASSNMKENFDLKFVLFCAIVTSICFWSIWGLSKVFLKDDNIRGAFVQASFRGSAAVFGIAFIVNIYGNSGMAPLMILGAVPLYNMYSVIVLTFESNEKKDGGAFRAAVINICKNPIILAILFSTIFSFLGLYEKTPVILTKTIGNFAKMASPLALV